MAEDATRNVLFLCTGNSARSILAEALLNHFGRGKFRAYSAGSFPKGAVHPQALELLRMRNLPVADLRSKSWSEFERPDAPRMDFVFTVCDQAAAEVCPIWPGQPITAHWPCPDPAAFEGSDAERMAVFSNVLRMLQRRIETFVALPLSALLSGEAKRRVDEIGVTTVVKDR